MSMFTLYIARQDTVCHFKEVAKQDLSAAEQPHFQNIFSLFLLDSPDNPVMALVKSAESN